MPGFKTHAKTGAITGAVTNIALQLRDRGHEPDRPLMDRLLEILAAIGAGTAGGIAPDIIEPATTPNHRALFHSKVVFGIGMLVAAKESKDRTPAARIMCSGYAGYISHLVLDARTPKGLPLIA